MLWYNADKQFFKLSGHLRVPMTFPADVSRHWDTRLPWHGAKSNHFFVDGIAYASGKHACYCPVSPELGIKMGFGGRRGTVRPKRSVRRMYRFTMRHARAGIGPECHGFICGEVDVVLVTGRHIGKEEPAYGVLTTRVHRPPNARYKLVDGCREYDFDVVDPKEHPKHSAKGREEFMELVLRAIRSKKIERYKRQSVKEMFTLGQIGYCTVQKRWFMLDCGA